MSDVGGASRAVIAKQKREIKKQIDAEHKRPMICFEATAETLDVAVATAINEWGQWAPRRQL